MIIDFTERKTIEIWRFWHPRPFDGISKDYSCWYWYLWGSTEQFLEQIVQISVNFISNKSKLMKRKEWYHVSLTSNISAKTWSNWTCRGCFEIVRTSSFQNWHWFWNLSKICWSNRTKQNTTNLWSQLYISFLPRTWEALHWSDIMKKIGFCKILWSVVPILEIDF